MSDTAPVTEDEFSAWLEHPVTRWAQSAASALADDRRAAWADASWEAGQCDPLMLRELRGQADAHLWLSNVDYPAVCAALEQEPVTDSE